MILAVATLLLHSAAVPQAVASSATVFAAAQVSSAPAEAASASSPHANAPAGTAKEEAVEASTVFPAAEFDTDRVSYEPGRTTPEVVSGSHPINVIVVPVFPTTSELQGIEPADERARLKAEERRRNREWLALVVVQHSAATFDAWTTRRAVSSGGGTEANPLLKPFAGNGSIYAAIQAGPLVLDYVSRRMMHSEHPWVRHSWWVPQVVGSALSFGTGIHNLANVR